MQIVQAAPPKETMRKRVTYRRNYNELFEALRRNEGIWLAVNPGDIAGETSSRKQTVIYLSARIRNVKVQTTMQGGMMYIRTYREEVSNA